MSNNQYVGPSIVNLEQINNTVTNQNPNYIAARREYDKIIENASRFISTYGPVTQLALSRNAYKDGKDIHNPNFPKNVLYLSADYVMNPLGWNHTVYISTHTITPMLKFILLTEGWNSYSGDDGFYIHLKRNGNLCMY